jgi:hypothetical protein
MEPDGFQIPGRNPAASGTNPAGFQIVLGFDAAWFSDSFGRVFRLGGRISDSFGRVLGGFSDFQSTPPWMTPTPLG